MFASRKRLSRTVTPATWVNEPVPVGGQIVKHAITLVAASGDAHDESQGEEKAAREAERDGFGSSWFHGSHANGSELE